MRVCVCVRVSCLSRGDPPRQNRRCRRRISLRVMLHMLPPKIASSSLFSPVFADVCPTSHVDRSPSKMALPAEFCTQDTQGHRAVPPSHGVMAVPP